MSNNTKKAGFSLVELLVVVSIVGIILTVGFLNYPKMRQQLELDRVAHQLVQEIRRAQGMAMSATELKEVESCFLPLQFASVSKNSKPDMVLADAGEQLLGGSYILVPEGTVAKGYGIYINLSDDNKSYKLYADTSAEFGTLDCQSTEPCWEYYNSGTPGDCYWTIPIEEKGIIISQINNTIDMAQKVSINFKPPNPDTNIKWLDPDPAIKGVEIVLSVESNSSKTKTVFVNRSGLIEVK